MILSWVFVTREFRPARRGDLSFLSWGAALPIERARILLSCS